MAAPEMTSVYGKVHATVEDTSDGEKGETLTTIELTTAREKKLLRKIDTILLPILLFSFMLQFIDKTALGYTAILGIIQELKLKGQDYSWASSAFYYGYLVATPITSVLLVKFPLGKFLACSVFIWGIVAACQGAVNNATSLTAMRVLLGVFESAITPGFTLLTGIWYKRSEHAMRHGIWFAGNSLTGLFAGLMCYGIGHIKGSLSPWRWVFIVLGIITMAWAFVMFFFLPDNPLTARWLNPSERLMAHKRLQKSTHSRVWKWDQFWEALRDPKSWLLFLYMVAATIPNGGLTAFGSLLTAGFGFTVFETLLVGIPSSGVAVFCVLVFSYLAGRITYSRCILIAILMMLSTAGMLMIMLIPSSQKWSRLGGLWIFGTFAGSFPLAISIIATNVAGQTKKATVGGMLFIGLNVGNIIGPMVFFTKEAPKYHSGLVATLVSLIAAAAIIMILRTYMFWENHRRNKAQGVNIDPEARHSIITEEDESQRILAELDETDWQNMAFRYYL
ncbi:hypothetical protein V500_03712 [Pseudogymnoascus sp. VKM F-4518 (FW-2643)]|nr:hypothetical protein V500_03712 [Pseudogymnoascus sp. VKM F-4518 (FW-2643)]